MAAQQSFLQEHLSNACYLRSRESELADLLVLAFNNRDLDLLDKAKLHTQLPYQDREVQALIRDLDIFAQWEGADANANAGGDEARAAPAPAAAAVVVADKSALFQTAPSCKHAEQQQAAVGPQTVPSAADSAGEEVIDLDALVIEEDAEEEEEVAAAAAAVAEDEDELDLS